MRRLITSNGCYYIFHAPDGALTNDAVSVLRAAARTGASLIYGDELKETADGVQTPLRKPEPSPDTLLSYNYIGSPAAVSEALLNMTGLPDGNDYAARWAFILRAFFSSDHVLHVPRILFYGKQEQKIADIALVQRQLQRLERLAEAVPARAEGCVSVHYACPPTTLLSVIVALRGNAEALRDTLDSVELWNTSARIEYVVIDGGTPSERNEAYYRALENNGVRILRAWYEPNLARLFNLAAAEALGEAMIFLCAGDRIMHTDALMRMLAFAVQSHIGAAGAWPAKPKREEAYVKNVRLIRHAPMLSRDMLKKSGGFDESFATQSCIMALSLLLRERRMLLVQTPDAVIEPAPAECDEDEQTQLRRRDLSI